MRVTFDTNSLDRACRPERFPKDPNQPLYQKVNAAIKAGHIQGFYSVTLLTIEAIQRKDRAPVFGDTRMQFASETISTTKNADLPQHVRDFIGDGDVETVTVNYNVVQPKRAPLHQEFQNRVAAAKTLGFRVLKAVPRFGAFNYTDPTGEYYLPNDDQGQYGAWKAKIDELMKEQTARNVGYAQVHSLGEKIARETNSNVPWFDALEKARDVHEVAAVQRGFSEWADGDSIASHIAYGDIDVFCSADKGKSNANASVLDAAHRQWLTNDYGVKFKTIEEIANLLP